MSPGVSSLSMRAKNRYNGENIMEAAMEDQHLLPVGEAAPRTRTLTIGTRTFLVSVAILLALMIGAGLLTVFVPAGSYDRIEADGRTTILPDSFHLSEAKAYPVWRWFTAPVEVLGADGSTTIIAIILFLLVIGGSIAVLDRSGVLNAILGAMVRRFEKAKYTLMGVLVLAFMTMGAVIGMFEETVALIPLFIALACRLGWDSLTGLGLVLLSTGFGFSAAVTNPFTIGIAQGIAGLPTFSGFGYRLVVFAVFYAALFLFLRRYAKRIEADPTRSPVYALDRANQLPATHPDAAFQDTPRLRRAVRWFTGCMLGMFVLLLAGTVLPAISDLSLPLVGLAFLLGGLGAGLWSGMGARGTVSVFGKGSLGLAPAILLILMASSVKHIITTAGILDTLLHGMANLLTGVPPFVAVVLVYLLVLLMELFIGSGSAKAFLVMPIVVPLADLLGIHRQVMVLAYQFGDGFSNLFYPTNPVLLIGLGLTVVSYPAWIRWVAKLQGVVFLLTLALLEIALLTGYGPF